MKKLSFLAVALFAVAGCQTDVNIVTSVEALRGDIPLSGYPNAATVVDVEVPSCTSYKDDRLASTSVLEARSIVEEYVKTAEYSGCIDRGYESYAQFVLPTYVGKITQERLDKAFDLDGLHIATTSSDKEVRIVLGTNLQKALKRSSDGVNVKIRLSNNTGNEFHGELGDVLVDQGNDELVPMVEAGGTIRPGYTWTWSLNNVRSQALAKDGFVTIINK